MSLANLDLTLLQHANTVARHHDSGEDALKAFVAASEALFAGLLVVVAAVGFALRQRAMFAAAVAGGVSAALALGVGVILSALVNRPRPFVAHPSVHDFLHHAADASFPSDHATAAFAIAGALVFRVPRIGIPAMVAAVVLAIGRVVLGVHYPSDVLAGAALGLAAAVGLARPWPRQVGDRLMARAPRLRAATP